MAAASLTQLKNYAYRFALNRTHSFALVSRYMQKIIAGISRYAHEIIMVLRRFVVAFHSSPFWIQLSYFVSLALLGSLVMMILKPSNPAFSSPRFVDMLFMSASAVTVSGLGTVEMEIFSSSQIAVLTLLMFLGGEVFVCLLGLLLRKDKHGDPDATDNNRVDSVVTAEHDAMDSSNAIDCCIELSPTFIGSDISVSEGKNSAHLRLGSVQYLGLVVSVYVLLIHVAGSLLILLYMTSVSSAGKVLKRKGIHIFLFSLATTVSSFANGGLIPTNENMAIFKVNPGLLLLIIPQILAGNTLFPLFLRLVIWALRRFTKAAEFEYMLKNSREIRFCHLLPNLQAAFLSLTVLSFIAAMVVLFCSLDWDSAVFDGLNSYQKIVNALFMAVNIRHAGESSIDVSLASPAVLVLSIVMMYLPSSTSFSPIQEIDTSSMRQKKSKRKGQLVQNLILSPRSYIVIFVIVVCITERRKLAKDPLNFSTLNIVLEVISGYGNVGLSTGYSCARLQQLHQDVNCQNKSYSFSGTWSDEGKLILAFTMLYGRLKKFSMEGGKAWKIV